MTDVRIVNITNLWGTTADWALTPLGTLDETQELANAIRVALMTDYLADVTEQLPDLNSTDRHGWWGDFDADVVWGGWPIGCKNWLLTRAKISDSGSGEGATLARAEDYTRTAMRPFLDQKLASRIEVSASRIGLERIEVLITVYRGPKQAIQLQFQGLWDDFVAGK
jgi:phage gp46-like protein